MRKVFWYWYRWCWWKYNLQNHLIFFVTHANVNLCATYEVCPMQFPSTSINPEKCQKTTISVREGSQQYSRWIKYWSLYAGSGLEIPRGVTTIFPMNKILVAVCWLRSRNSSVLWYWKHEWLARAPAHGRYQIDGVQPDIANRTH